MTPVKWSGSTSGPDSVQHGYLQRGNDFTTFDFPGDLATSFPFQINNSGTIVGINFDSQGFAHGFLAEQQSADHDGAQNQNDPPPIIKGASLQGCSSSDFAENPELIRNPRACN